MVAVTIILLAAGKSTRFGRPKQSERLGPKGETIPELTLRDAFVHGCTRAVIVVRPELEEHFRVTLGSDPRIAIVVQHEALGTAHATMLALDRSEGTVIIANGDDLYGARSMAMACDHAINGQKDEHALVAFALGNTLSPNGGVNRAVCAVGESGLLLSTTEVFSLRRDTGNGIIDQQGAAWPEDTLVSMNLWVLRPPMRRFFSDGFAQRDDNPEFGLPEVVRAAIADGEHFRSLTSPDPWLGLTFAEDAQLVRDQLRERHAS